MTVRTLPDAQGFELVSPRCAVERADDIDEVEQMIEAGETDVARDELRWLLAECSDCLAAHRLLGQIALEEEDFGLARGHFGTAYQIVLKALGKTRRDSPLPYAKAANRVFFECGKGLAWSLLRLGRRRLAREVVEQLVRSDPTDPLGVQGLLAEAERKEDPPAHDAE